MRADGFFVVGREAPGDVVEFMHTCMVGGLPMRRWSALESADRYLMSEDAKKAAENAPRQCESDEPAAVWRVEVTATKETA